jgi:hypothetical protein
MATPIDDFIAGQNNFLAGVKGVGYTPGELGFQDMVFPGKRAIGNQVTQFKAGSVGNYVNDSSSLGTSYWWNIDASTNPKANIFTLAQGSIAYANSERDKAKIIDGISDGVHSLHGMSREQFTGALNSPDYRGSVVFSRLDSNWTEGFRELDKAGDGLQSAKASRPFRIQSLPERSKVQSCRTD